MRNTTNGQLVFRKTGTQLHHDIFESLESSALALLMLIDKEDLNLDTVTTKTNLLAGFSKYIFGHTLKVNNFFDETYIKNAWEMYCAVPQDISEKQFYDLTLSEQYLDFPFKKSYAQTFRRGIGFFLLALHSRCAITLPASFDWPPKVSGMGKINESVRVFSEMLAFIRELDCDSTDVLHPAFSAIGTLKKRRERFLCYGTKLLLATGWHRPEDACLEDLLAIRAAEADMGVPENGLAYRMLIDVLRMGYGTAFAITLEDWTRAVNKQSVDVRIGLERILSQQSSQILKNESDDGMDLLYHAITLTPRNAQPDVLRSLDRLPGLAGEFSTLSKKWLNLQDIYKNNVKKENYKPVNYSLGYLNIYLFFYLAYWFKQNPGTTFQFPDEPSKLIGSVFVFRLIVSNDKVPLTFIEFMDAMHAQRKWVNNRYYALLKQVATFFSFLEQNNEDLPGCDGFRQPIPDYAYPPSSRSSRTNKQPIPRYAFGAFIDYVEALRAFVSVVLDGILEGSVSVKILKREIKKTGNVIDTLAISEIVGFIPVLFFRGRSIPIRYIPNCLYLTAFDMGGRYVTLPQPHVLNQMLVALYTGLRFNHIQWLDARNFDSKVDEDSREFPLLYVNTDKSKREAWTPYVNFRVIQILRYQKKWRQLVKSESFKELHFYNNNPKTKWPRILPLFSSTSDGSPSSYSKYAALWNEILYAVNLLLLSVGVKRLQRFCVLGPPNVSFEDSEDMEKKRQYGSSCSSSCKLRIASSITPHSARVTVVSQHATFLPAEVIGTYITGQTPAVVYHYVKLEEEQIAAYQAQQSLSLREFAYRNEFEALVSADKDSKSHIHADAINSNFSKGLQQDLHETLLTYGCVSIILNEDATSGLDVLRETRALSAAENKTEICPYGNQCPPEIIKEWRGARRCGLCQYAVRSIDHLPAVSAKVKEFAEMLHDLTEKLRVAIEVRNSRYSDEELDRLDEERSRIAEELTGWRLSEEVLDAARIRIAAGQDSRRWVVQKPEIIEKDLQRIPAPDNATSYLLARLQECISFPMSESPQIKARFDLLRRKLLAHSGQFDKVFDTDFVADPAAECAGLLRSIVQSNGLSYGDVVNLLESEEHLSSLSVTSRLLLQG